MYSQPYCSGRKMNPSHVTDKKKIVYLEKPCVINIVSSATMGEAIIWTFFMFKFP